MITQFLFSILMTIAGVLFGWLPAVETLPLGIDDALSTVFGWMRSFITEVWPAQVVLEVVLWYLGFRVGLIVLKLFLGHRAPKHH